MLTRTDNIGIRICNIDEMKSHIDQWTQLAEFSLEDNVYYSPHYVLSLLEAFGDDGPVNFITAWTGGQLRGLLPVTKSHGIGASVLRPAQAWETLFTFSCMPLIHRDEPETTAKALIEGMESVSPGVWAIPNLYLDGTIASHLTDALTYCGISFRTTKKYERAYLDPVSSFDQHLQQYVKSKRRREFKRCLRRLEEQGTVEYEHFERDKALERSVDAFLELEKSGWKGDRGTALACEPDTLDFAKRAFQSVDGFRCRSDVLSLNGSPIAVGITVFGGDTAFTIKGAYDESLSTFSPGLLLELKILEDFLTHKWAARLDAATAGEHVIDALWPGRRSVGTLSFSFSRYLSNHQLAMLENADLLKTQVKQKVKRLIGRK